jgi:hypothetical protein
MNRAIFVILLFIITPTICLGYGNHQTLEITNIKASGSGSPATTQYNRIYRAYPGIQYKIPVGVIGGLYPYTFSLSNEPSGMTISTDGIITWTNPQSSAPNITVRATDLDGDYTEATWSITVGTSGFIFIDSSAGSGGDGTISSPYDTIDDVLALEGSAVNSIVYVRAGTYAVPMHNGFRTSPGTYGCNFMGRAHVWIGYPDETIVWNMGGVNASYAWWMETHDGISTQMECWFENIKFQSPREWGFRHSAGGHYLTFFSITMDDLVGSNIANNCGGLFSQNYGDIYYTHIADSSFTAFDTAHSIGSIYDSHKMLIERNLLDGKIGLGSSIAIKVDCEYTTIRKNTILNTDAAFAHSNNGIWHNSIYNEICYNFTDSPTGRWNIEPPPDDNTLTTWFYRNTVVGTCEFVNLDSPDGCEGPWYVENNVFQNNNNATYGIYFNTTSGIPGAGTADGYLCINELDTNLAAASGLVDSDGFLINEDYLGIYGWQTGDDESPEPDTPGPGSITKNGASSLTKSGASTISIGGE